MIIFIDMKGVNMDLIIPTFPLDGKTLYYVQCPVCKNNRILNSGANVSRTISDDTFRKLCGCTCDVKQAKQAVKEVAVQNKVEKTAVEKETAPKRTGKVLTAVINGKEMTVKEIAETYDISTSTVRQRINAGKPESEIIAPTKKKK
jgi:cobalamin biosynthesis protein CbiG